MGLPDHSGILKQEERKINTNKYINSVKNKDKGWKKPLKGVVHTQVTIFKLFPVESYLDRINEDQRTN